MASNSTALMDRPRFQHDCPACTFLGRFRGADLYHCLQDGPARLPTVIARHSSDAPDYTNGLPNADGNAELREARERARALGLKIDLAIH